MAASFSAGVSVRRAGVRSARRAGRGLAHPSSKVSTRVALKVFMPGFSARGTPAAVGTPVAPGVVQEVTMALTAEEARGTILAQHDTIRMLLRAAGTVADLAAGGSRRVSDLLPHYLDSVRAALDQH